jgi:hypothetical protein
MWRSAWQLDKLKMMGRTVVVYWLITIRLCVRVVHVAIQPLMRMSVGVDEDLHVINRI